MIITVCNVVGFVSRAGKVTYKTALDMSLYLHKEKDYVAWSAGGAALAYIGARLSLTPNYGLYQVQFIYFID